MKFVSLISSMVCFFTTASALTLSEKDAVMWALEANPDIMVSFISSHRESLTLQQAEADWLPGMQLSAESAYNPLSSGAVAPDPSLHNAAAVTFSQIIPGGGVAGISMHQSVSTVLDTSIQKYGSSIDASYTQPLLKNAWGNAALDNKIKIALLNHQAFSLRQKKNILAELSAVRTRFWTYYEQKQLEQIALDASTFAEEQHAYEQARFSIGQSAELDTLNAALALSQAEKRLLYARNGVRQARRDLGVRLMLAGDAIEIPDNPNASVHTLPTAEVFIKMAKKFDPELQIFALTRERLQHQYKNDRNQLLPQLDAVVSYQYAQAGNELFSNGGVSKNALVKLVFGYALPIRATRMASEHTRFLQKENEIQAKRYRFLLKNNITNLIDTWELERMGLKIMRKSADIAQRQLTAMNAAYQLGSISRLALLEAENARTSAATEFVRAQVTMKRLEIIFDEITGKLFDTFGVQL